MLYSAQLRSVSPLIYLAALLYLTPTLTTAPNHPHPPTPDQAKAPLHLTSDLLSTLSCLFDHCTVEWFIFVAQDTSFHACAANTLGVQRKGK